MILNQTTSFNPLTGGRRNFSDKALEVFESAGSGSDAYIPGLEEHYENLALSYLEQWTNPTESTPAPKVQTESPLPKQTQPASFTTFNTELGWQIADHR